MNTYSELDKKILGFEKYINFPSVPRLLRFTRIGTKFMLASADCLGLIISVWLAITLFSFIDPLRSRSVLFILGPLLLVFGATYTLAGLYRSRAVSQVEEIRQLTGTTNIVFLSLFAFHALWGNAEFPIILIALSWLFAVGLIPFARAAVRSLGSALGIWGEPVVVLGSGALSRSIIHYLRKNPYYGLRPVMVVDGLTDSDEDPDAIDLNIPKIPLNLWLETYASGSKIGVDTAIVVASELPASRCDSITRGEHLGFTNIITVSRQFNTRNAGLMPLDFGGVLGLEERHYELNTIENWQIRVFDLLMIFLSLPLLIPLMLFIIIAIRLDAKGNAFYSQTRIGKRGREFKVFKFRTMINNADQVLKKCLQENPDLLAEWQADHKLKNDPRITRIGRFLRKTSLDELPQLWNVVRGEMSLVGPRPIVNAEIERYGDLFEYYTQVPPGITGLWQVSGRNNINYEQRVHLDEYYVRNRSIWMNFYILVRTAAVVIQRQGAY